MTIRSDLLKKKRFVSRISSSAKHFNRGEHGATLQFQYLTVIAAVLENHYPLLQSPKPSVRWIIRLASRQCCCGQNPFTERSEFFRQRVTADCLDRYFDSTSRPLPVDLITCTFVTVIIIILLDSERNGECFDFIMICTFFFVV